MDDGLKAPQKLMIAIVVAVTGALLLAVGVYAYDGSQSDQIAPGVRVGGIDIGARSADEARAVIEEEVVSPLQKPVEVSFGGETYRLSSKRLRQSADVDGMIDEAIDASREGSIVTRVGRYVQGSTVNVNLEPKVAYSADAVDKFVSGVAEKVNRDAQNASIEPNGDSLTPTPGRPGLALHENALRDQVIAEVEEPGAGEKISASADKTAPEITTKELASQYPLYITVDRAAFKVRLFANLKLAKTYTVGIGQAGYDTPSGLYNVESKQVDPTWYVPDSDWAGDLAGQTVPPGPSNPLKARWMGIFNGAGFHGTDDVASLGTAASHGCVRMAISDVIELYDRVEVGTPVYIQ
ncbi:hypothetical protein BH20ACT15_BH20ACT15_10840 [soil metagenome]